MTILIVGYCTQTIVQAQSSDRVLLVYDSENTIDHGQKKIDAIQRILTGMNLRVKTKKVSDYQKGELNQNYTGVITMINWNQANLDQTTFIHDRTRFNGIKLHIGPGMDPDELKAFGASSNKVYQKQLTLVDGENKQQLPFTETMETLTNLSRHSQTIGKLVTQEKNQKNFNYGVISGKNGYLPFFETKSLSLLSATKLITKLFQEKRTYQPLLTFTNVSPYTDLNLLDQLSQYCEDQDIPFAISTVTVAKNTEMQAYRRFTTALRKIESRNGLIFLNAPVIGGATKDTGPELSDLFDGYLLSFAREQVYPVGISTPGFWNQDQTLRSGSLVKANTWLLLPNKKTTFVNEDHQGQVANRSYYAIDSASISTIQNQDRLEFNIPTAVTIGMPDSQRKLKNVEEQISKLNFNWENPSQNGLKTKIDFASSSIEYREEQYFVNQKPVEIDVNYHNQDASQTTSTNKVLLKGFFHVQGQIISILFVVILIVLVVFIIIGRKIYNNNFKR